MKINKDNASHYTWGNNCDGWHLVCRPELSVIQEKMPPSASEVRHYHSLARQFFYVLSGELTIECEGISFRLVPGDGFEIRPGESHQVKNDSQGLVEFIVVSQPMAQGDRQPA